MKSEKDVKREVKRLLDKYNFFWWMPAANGYGKAGVSDFNAMRSGGTFMAIETKFGSNKATPLQKAYLESIQSCDGLAFVVSDKNIEFFEQFLEAFEVNVRAVGLSEPGSDPRKAVDVDYGAMMTNAAIVLTEGWRE